MFEANNLGRKMNREIWQLYSRERNKKRASKNGKRRLISVSHLFQFAVYNPIPVYNLNLQNENNNLKKTELWDMNKWTKTTHPKTKLFTKKNFT